MKKRPKLEKTYEAVSHEAGLYAEWEAAGYFKPSLDEKKQPFCITMPPPNTTGQLHLGHASTLAYEDLMIRYKRLRGYDVLYIPGTDHAAIATQNKVERIISNEGLTREKLGREKFLERVRKFVHESQGTIKHQIRSMGASCDWSREAYTFDDVSSQVVNEVFIKMYKDNLIYRGNRIVNWCTYCHSVLADDEVEYVEKKTPFYYFKYGPVVIGTARPETKFADKVIVVHPDDKRFKSLIGKEFDVPWIEGTVKAKVIADEVADPEIGSGAMTITPAHSFEDFELAQKYKLDIEQIINTEGKLTAAAGSMAGLPVEAARKKVVEALKKKKLLESIDTDYVHNLSVCYRCGNSVQPLISKQWFVDVNKKVPGRNKSLKEMANDMVRNGDIEIIPDRFKKVYFHWMDNLHDWCISRQIWWGHRIPVWYGKDGEPVVSVESPGAGYKQDDDTLDTWFSSATWTFSTLLDRNYGAYKDFKDWISHSADLKRFHPTSVLETGYDILFFWIARMVLITSYVLDEKPFDQVYLHGMVRDKQGRKMSKSRDNGIDPIKMIDRYGADALRLSLVIGSAPGQDLRLYDEKIAGYRNFVNKLWNIARFVFSNAGEIRVISEKPKPTDAIDAALLFELDALTKKVSESYDSWKFSIAGEELYHFTWGTFADWYVEIAKVQSKKSSEVKEKKDEMLLYVLNKLLILWHPSAPFITDVLWKQFGAEGSIMVQSWEEPRKRVSKPKSYTHWESLKELITYIRTVRAEQSIPASTIISVSIKSSWHEEYSDVIERLARCRIDSALTKGHVFTANEYTLTIDISSQMSAAKRDKLKKYISNLEKKLSNKTFTEKAPKNIVDQERAKLEEAKKKFN